MDVLEKFFTVNAFYVNSCKVLNKLITKTEKQTKAKENKKKACIINILSLDHKKVFNETNIKFSLRFSLTNVYLLHCSSVTETGKLVWYYLSLKYSVCLRNCQSRPTSSNFF